MKFYLQATVLAMAALLGGGVAACDPSYSYERDPKYALDQPTKGRLTAQFFGVSTILLNDGTTAVMTDGFFSRPPFEKLLMVGPDKGQIQYALAKGAVADLAALMVSHSHYDHALDSAFVAKEKSALLIGSKSTAALADGELPRGQILVMNAGDIIRVGTFDITVFESRHSVGGLEDLLQGEIEKKFKPPAPFFKYREGGTYSFLIENAGFRILVHPSANVVPGMYKGVRADVVFLATATMGKDETCARWYLDQVVGATGARLVIPLHWDNFLRPLSERLTPSVLPPGDYAKGMATLMKSLPADRVRVGFMRSFEPLDIVAAAGPPIDGPPPPPLQPRPSSCP